MSTDITPFGFASNDDVPRTVKAGVEYFHLVSVCRKLGIGQSGAYDWVKRLPKGLVIDAPLETAGGTQTAKYVHPDGIRLIIQGSTKPISKEIRAWLATEVFKKVTEEGGYIAPWITEEQLARIQEQVDYKVIRNLMANAIDYDPSSEVAQLFFGRMQNLFHEALTGLNAKQIIAARKDSIVTWTGKRGPTKKDKEIAKNYLTSDELELYGINVTYVLTKARRRFFKKPYTMQDVIRVVSEGLKEE